MISIELIKVNKHDNKWLYSKKGQLKLAIDQKIENVEKIAPLVPANI